MDILSFINIGLSTIVIGFLVSISLQVGKINGSYLTHMKGCDTRFTRIELDLRTLGIKDVAQCEKKLEDDISDEKRLLTIESDVKELLKRK